MAKRKSKPDLVVDLSAAEAEAHARAESVTDPAAFEFPGPAGDHTDTGSPAHHGDGTPTPDVTPDAESGEEKTWNPLFGLRADHEIGVGLLEDRRFKQMQIRFADKPSEAVRTVIREAGYQWRSQDQAWTKQLDPQATWRTRAEAGQLFDRVVGLIRAERGLGPAGDGPQPD